MRTENDIQLVPWVEIAKLPAGGFAVFTLNDYGEKRKPVFAATSLDEVFEFLRPQFDRAPTIQRNGEAAA